MIWTDDPERDFAEWDAEREDWLKRLPRCSECDEYIQSDICYRINDELICEDCIENYKVYVDELVGE